MHGISGTRALALSALLVGALVQSAPAAAQALDPLNRLHVGASLVEGPSPLGITGGFDSRLTRMAFVDAGGVGSFGYPDASLLDEDTAPEDALRLRHAIYIALGLRVPHAQPEAFSFDIFPRAGMAAVWLSDLASEPIEGQSPYQNEVAGILGLDLTLQRDAVGLRLGYRHYLCTPFVPDRKEDVFMATPMFTLEGQYQFGGDRRR
jgi:hypothetical protein